MTNASPAPDLSESFAAVWERQHPRLLTWLRVKGAPDSLIEDMASETFLRAWRHWEAFDNKDVAGKVAAWLYLIAGRLLMDYRRSAQSQVRSLDAQVAKNDPTLVGNLVADRAPSPEAWAEWQETAAAIQQACKGADYQIVMGQYWYGFDEDELAERMGMKSTGGIRIRVHRLRNRLMGADRPRSGSRRIKQNDGGTAA